MIFHNLHTLLCGIFHPNSVVIAGLFIKYAIQNIGELLGRFLISIISPGKINIIESTCKGGQSVIMAGVLAGVFPFPDNISGKILKKNVSEAAVDKPIEKVPVLIPVFKAMDYMRMIIINSLKL